MKIRLRVSYMVLGAVLGIITLFTQATPVEAFSFSFPNIPDIRSIIIRLFPFPNLPPLKPLPTIRPLRPFQDPLASLTPTLVPTSTPTPVPPTETPMPTLTPIPTDTPTPTPTLTPVPTDTPAPTPTSTPTSTPIPVPPTETPTPTPTPTTSATSGLVAYWKMEEGAGSAILDSSGNNHTLTIQGISNWSSDIPPTSNPDTKSVLFDGSTFAGLANSAQNMEFNFPTSFTLEAWIKADGTSNAGIVSKFFPGNNGYMMWFFDDKVVNYVDGPKVWGLSNILNSWHHVAATWDGQILSLYVDGVKDNSDQTYKNPPGGLGNILLIGSYNPVAGYNFKGNLDEIKIYNYARSASEIISDAGLANSPAPTDTPSPSPTPTSIPTITPAPTIGSGSVVINEIMWPGSSISSSDEWIELRNTTSSPIDLTNWVVDNLGSSSSANIIIPTTVPNRTIAANGYYLISNYPKNNSIMDIDPEFVTASVSLDNSGEKLTLKNSTGDIIDVANQVGSWFAGTSTTPHKSMSRKNPPGDGTSASSWFTSTGSVNLDANATESASPKANNI